MTIDLIQIAPVCLLQSAIDEVNPVVVVDNHAASGASTNGVAPLIRIQRIEIVGIMFSNVDGYAGVRAPAAQT